MLLLDTWLPLVLMDEKLKTGNSFIQVGHLAVALQESADPLYLNGWQNQEGQVNDAMLSYAEQLMGYGNSGQSGQSSGQGKIAAGAANNNVLQVSAVSTMYIYGGLSGGAAIPANIIELCNKANTDGFKVGVVSGIWLGYAGICWDMAGIWLG